MKTIFLLAASLAVFAQAPGAVRYLSYGGAPTAGDCTLALAGARVGVDTSTTPDTVYDCIDGGWVARPVKVVSGVPTVQSATDTKLVVKAGASQAGNLQEWQDSAGGVAVNITSDGSIGLTYLADPIFQTAISPGLLEFYGDSSQSLQLDANTPGTLRIAANTSAGDRNALAVNASTTTIQDDTATTGATMVDIAAGAAQTTKSVVLQTGGRITMPLTTPTTSAETCTAGTFTADTSYVYVCTSANTWKRAALSAF